MRELLRGRTRTFLIYKLIFTLLSIIILSLPVFSQTAEKCLCGTIKDTNGALVGGATVKILANQKLTETDSNGEFRFENLSQGKYQIVVSAKGFVVKTASVEFGKPIEITLEQQGVAEVVSISASYLAGTPDALERTAGSIQLLGKQELEQARVFNFSEALRKFSGVNVRDEEGFGLRPNIGIRGTNPTRSTKVLLLEDGLPLAYAPYGDNASYYHPPVERFESIEVLKGSGQIEYGPVTVAGVVNYITPNPPDEPTFSLKLLGGNRSFFNGNAQFGGTFGKTGVIFNFNRKQGEGSRDNVKLGLSDFSAKIVQTLNERNILTGKFSFLREDSRVTYSGLTEAEYFADPRQNPFRNDSFNAFRHGFSLQHTGILTSRTSLTTAFYTNYFSRDWWRQSSNSAQRPNRLNVDTDCRSMADLNTTCGNEGRLRDYRTVGIEPRFNANFDIGSVRNNLSLGFRFHREAQNRLQKNGDLPNSRDGIIVEDNLRKNSAFSGFVQNRFVWKDFAFTTGVRIENIKYKRENRLTGAGGKTEITEVIPGFGATYNLFGNTTLFAGVHRGFAPPRTEDIISNTGGVVDLDAERSWNYEVGVRARPFDGISLDATFFRTDYENQIVPASVAGGVGAVFTNGGRTLHQGLELSGRFDSSNFFNTDFNIYLQTSYTNLFTAEFRGARYSSISGLTNVLITGNRLPYAPGQTLNAALGFAYRNFDAFVENNYIGRQFSDDLNTTNPTANGQRGAIPAQTYWNATANYKVENLKSVFFVTIKNIFDRTFIVDRSRGILPSSPRLVQAGIQIRF
jgi:Fe(3+) dicitrate transport protein